MRILPLLLLLTVHSAWSKADQKSQQVTFQSSKVSLEDNIVGKTITLEVKGEAVYQMMFHANGLILLGKNNNLRDKGVTYQINNNKVLFIENGKTNGGMSFFSSSPKVGDHVEVGADGDKQKVKIFKIEPYIGGIHREDVEFRERIAYFGGSPYTGKVFGLYKNGRKDGESHFKDGKLNGSVTQWYENGQKKSESNWKDGKKDGLSVSWYENGEMFFKRIFKNGKPDGLFISWHDNGQKNYEQTFKDGEPYGLHLSWHSNGQKMSEEKWKNGKLINDSFKLWNSKGRPVDTIEEGVVFNHLESREGLVYLKGATKPYTGKEIRYYRDKEQLQFEFNYKDGKQDGLLLQWHENGQKLSEAKAKNGKLVEGSAKFWNNKGEGVDSMKKAVLGN